MALKPSAVEDIKSARVLAVLGDSVTTDHISPAGSIKKDGPAGKYLIAHGVQPADFNSYGSRRGNHEVMVRGTFANVRLRNKMVNIEGGFTRHLPDGAEMSIFDASEKYHCRKSAASDSGRQGIWLRIVARLGRQGTALARGSRRNCGKLRTHPPLESRRHGHSASAVPAGRECRDAEIDRRRSFRDHRNSRDSRESFLPARKLQCEQKASRNFRRSCASTLRRKRSTTPTEASCSTCSASCLQGKRSRKR